MSDNAWLSFGLGVVAFGLWLWTSHLQDVIRGLEDERDQLANEVVRLAGEPADEGNHLA